VEMERKTGLTSHKVVVLGHLLGRLASLDVGEESHKDVLCEGSDVGLGEASEEEHKHSGFR
jgi:hypothetical protein